MRSILTAPRLLQLLVDLGVTLAAVPVAYMLRLEGRIPHPYAEQVWMLLPLALFVRLAWRLALSLHRPVWRYTGVREALEVAAAVTLGSLCLLIVSVLAFTPRVPWGVLVNEWWLTLAGYLSVRLLYRQFAERRPAMPSGKPRTRVLLVGAGQAGNLVAKEIHQHSPQLEVVGFVDDDATKLRSRIQGHEVLGLTADITRLVADHQVDEVLLCVPSASQAEMRRLIELGRASKAKVKTIPGIRELLAGSAPPKFREVQIEDLLNRDPVEMDHAVAGRYITGRTVMVTGAGGSIGSELCRQIAKLQPQRLVLVGRGEFSIYGIEMELRETHPQLALAALIADVRDELRMTRLFEAHRPDVVFHAAAHKHVPLMEGNPSEAILNNVFGTRTVATLADRFGAEAFVLVSTDKAVNPTNVMGASKRAAEMVVQELATHSRTRFMCVRFGNVLGSRGSVIPLFKRQIEAGGPITLTHPEIIRYFMTIPEAAQLVLQAGAIGQGGEVFVLDMGQPVKIVDVARDLIRLSGLEPEVDIQIVYTGLRPGEKLYEELLTAQEGTAATSYRKIFVARSEVLEPTTLARGLERLREAALSGDDAVMRGALQGLVTTYQPAQHGAKQEERSPS